MTAKKIVSFGDSFVFGSELKNNADGSAAWPGLIASDLGCEYKTFAKPGCGNDHIAQQMYSYFAENSAADTLVIINWTWSVRWDFYITKEILSTATISELAEHVSDTLYNTIAGPDWPLFTDFLNGSIGTTPKIQEEVKKFISSIKVRKNGMWVGLGPTCVPGKLSWMNNSIEAKRIIDFYSDYGNHNVVWNRFRNLQTIFAAQSYIKQKNITAIQTYMDYELFDSTYNELSPSYVKELQILVSPCVELFCNELNFLDWAVKNKFPVTTSPGDHPLEEAHNAARDLWRDRFRKKLYND